jgi:hypothetical protein
MGSLLPGWDRKRGGTIPKAMRDFEEPTKMPVSPHSSAAGTKPPSHVGSPPKLARTSCPPSLHGTVILPSQRTSGEHTSSSFKVSSLPGSPKSPPKHTSPFATSAPSGALFSKLLEKGEDEDEATQWCSRVESSALNQRPDQKADLEEWRKGSYKPEDTLHTMHILHCEPGSPKKLPSQG